MFRKTNSSATPARTDGTRCQQRFSGRRYRFLQHRFRPVVTLSMLLLLFAGVAACGEERQRPRAQFALGNPAGNASRFPDLNTPDEEVLYLSWLSKIDEELHTIEYSWLRANEWADPQTVYVGRNIFEHWAEKPNLVLLEDGQVVLQWLQTRQYEDGLDLQIAFQGQGPRQWSYVNPVPAGTAAETGSVDMIALEGSAVLTVWLEAETSGSQASETSDPQMGSEAPEGSVPQSRSGGSGQQSVQSQGFSAETQGSLQSAVAREDGTVRNVAGLEGILPVHPRLVSTEQGPVMVYAAETGQGDLQILAAPFEPEQATWGDPVVIHQAENDGRNLTGLTAASDGHHLLVAWQENLNEEADIWLARMEWGSGESPGTVSLGRENPLGRMSLAAAGEDNFYLAWMEGAGIDGTGALAAIWLQRIVEGSANGEPVAVANTDPAADSGIPVLIAMKDGIMLAWTQTQPLVRVRTAYFDFSNHLTPEATELIDG